MQDNQEILKLLKLTKKLGFHLTSVKSLLLILNLHLRNQLIQLLLWLQRKQQEKLQQTLLNKKKLLQSVLHNPRLEEEARLVVVLASVVE